MPNFDIIQPKLVRKTRGKRSFDSDSTSSSSKLIQIQGLGRQFEIHVKPNKKLLDPHFVFLKRNDNVSEIMPESHVRKELPCFYQGFVQHYSQDDPSTRVEGPVALNLCGGLVSTNIFKILCYVCTKKIVVRSGLVMIVLV